MKSDRVSKKIDIDMGLGKFISVEATPALYVDGQDINWSGIGSITINGKVISWETSRGGEKELTELFTDIYNAKMGL